MMIAKKSFIKILLLFILVFSLNLAIPAKTAYAQNVDPVQSVLQGAKWVWERVEQAYSKISGVIGNKVVESTVRMYTNQLAYNIATGIAQGAEDGGPLFRTSSVKKSLETAREAALGEFVTRLTTENFADLGFNLCDPSIEVKLTLTLNLIDSKAPPSPKCNWRDVQKQWAEFSDQVSSGRWQDFIKIKLDPRYGTAKDWNDFWSQFEEGKNDLSVLSTLKDKAEEIEADAVKVEELKAAECQGFLDKKTKITEEVKTHCSELLHISSNVKWDAILNGEFKIFGKDSKQANVKLSEILRDAGNMFLNTLSSKMLKFAIEEGQRKIASWYQQDGDLRPTLLSLLRGGADLRRAPRGSDVFRDLKTTSFEEVEDFSLVENFIICPDQVDFRHPDNCVMSTELLNVLAQKKTIQQAISDGDLNGNLPFISASDPRNNSDTCYKEGFCYHNLVKLRKANIIPIGWELAAQASSGGQAPTLKQVADCFENNTCAFASNDGNNPYYHLVDPNWVLKVPAARCEAFVYASTLEANGSNNRQQYCADVKTCLREDDEGNCLDDAYGYCTQSANVWRLDADICEDGDIYAGCLSFNNPDLGSASYLEQSLEYCGADGAGCKRYSQEKTASNDWVLEDVATDANDLFLNKQASSCNEEDGGCSEFIVMASNRSVNILPNGDFAYDKQGWLMGGAGIQNIVNDAYSGQNALEFSQNVSANVDTGYPLKDRTFILSFYAKTGNAGTPVTAFLANSTVVTNLTPSWQKIQIKHTFASTVNSSLVGLQFTSGASVIIDAIKLEEVANTQNEAGSFSGYGDGTRILMTDERQMCVAEEVGCQGYYPNNNDPMIPAVVNSGDLCPNECVGYENFAQAPTYFDLSENLAPETEYYNFIPSTAQSCPNVAIGCEEFTNEEAVEAGGEGKEYFTYLRQCVATDASNTATFYTWEGEDVAGYQLKTWTFLTNSSGAPCTNVDPGTETCLDDGLNDAMCGADTPDNQFDDPEYNPNCREFFDTDSNSYFRLQDKVVYASEDCKTYRRAASGQKYQAIADLSYSCSAQYNGCKAYTGNAANNVRRIFLDNFEGGTYNPWSGTGLDLSNQSLANNGHSLKIAANSTITKPVFNIRDKQSYQLTWWMKNTGNLSNVSAQLYDAVSEVAHPIESLGVTAAGDWRRYQLSIQAPIDFANLDDISLRLNFSGVGEIFLDNILLSEVTDNLSFVKNSWTTPASCDDPFAGAYLGCQAYTDTNGADYTFKSFSSLCREETIGCLAAIDTKNSKSPFSETFHQGDNSRIEVAADSITYLVPEQDKYCPQAYKGCSALGLPILDQAAGSITGFQTVYKINDPDKYTQSLCNNEDLYCEEYNSDKGTYYFKDPGNRTCSYQKNVNDNGIITSGWFKTDSLETADPVACSPAELDDWAQACPEDKNLCTEIKDPLDPITCDVNAPAGSVDACQSYYYYKNDKINQSSCNGQFDQNSGCTLLYDANLWNAAHTQVNVNYNASATYDANISSGRAVNPISNDSNNANMLVKVRKDRECSEWLDCKSASAVFNPRTNTYDTVCDAIGTCLEYDNTNSVNHCKRWAEETTEDDIALTADVYRDRATGANNHLAWSDSDYLGYSIPNLLPLDSLSTYNFSPDGPDGRPTDQNDIRLVYQADTNVCLGKPDGDSCSDQINSVNFDGECKDNICWLNPYTAENTIPMSLALDTRAYTAVDAPFAHNIREQKDQQNYSAANICESGDNSCEITYDKVTYGNSGIVKYLSKTESDDADKQGVCTMVSDPAPDGVSEGSFCASSADCIRGGANANEGRCTLKTKVETYMNWPGICLEEDPSTSITIDVDANASDVTQKRYCNQWYPVDEVAGAQSLYNNFKEAGFYNEQGTDLQMCVTPEDYVTAEDKYYCVAANQQNNNGGGVANTYCTVLAKVSADSRVNVNQGALFKTLNPLKSNNVFTLGQIGTTNILSRPHAEQNSTCDVRNPENQNSADENECFDQNDLFQEEDFMQNNGNLLLEEVVISMENLGLIFNQNINYYYFDEAIDAEGNWYPDPDNANGDENYKVLADGFNYTIGGDQHAAVCVPGKHQVKMLHWGGDNEMRYCNPGTTNYYIETASAAIDNGFAFPSVPTPELYPTEQSATSCSGFTCLQQCQVISEINADGDNDKSWVRTDIWWRYGQNNYNNSNWTAWYDNTEAPTEYQNSVVATSTVNLYFGSAENSDLSQPIITKTPVNTTRYANEAAIFFGDDIEEAREQMKYLFARLYNLTWTDAGYSAQSTENFSDNKINLVAGEDYVPLVYRVCANKLCAGNTQGITINNQNTGNMSGQGSLFTVAQFYYLAHPDHMPVTNVNVDWGDDTEDSNNEGKMKNNLPAEYCGPNYNIPGGNETQKMSFGGLARACHPGYKTFYHNYNYNPAAAYACNGTGGKPSITNASCYRPTVTVTDNWEQDSLAQSYAGWVVVYNNQ